MSASFVIVANSNAGTADRDAITRAADVLREAGDVSVTYTESLDDLEHVVGDVGDRILVIAGGDGSLHAAVNAWRRAGAQQDVTFGLVPLGTGNDLARTVGISFDPAEAAKTVISGQRRKLDMLVSDTGLAAVNAVHLGVGAEAVRHGAAAKRRLGAAGYAVGALVAGVRERGWRVSVEVDGKTLANDDVLMVGLAIGQTIGGGTPLAPDAAPQDGLCDVIVATGTGALQRTSFALRLKRGTHLDRPDVVAARGVRIVVHGDPIRANVDGELQEPQARWEWTLQRHAWQLIVPS